MTDITAGDLKKNNEEKNNKRNNIYRKILERCIVKIQKVNNMNQTELNYHVPGFLYGSPLYKYDDCVKYLENKLERRDFKVQKINDTTLHVSW